MRNRDLTEVGSTPDRRVFFYVENNEVGGRRYWLDSLGEGVMVWDTSLASPEEMRICLDIEMRLQREELGERPEPDAREVGPEDHPSDDPQKLPGPLPGHGDDRPIPQQDHEG
jgi:hypothetical protein